MNKDNKNNGLPFLPTLLSVVAIVYILVDAFTYKTAPDGFGFDGLRALTPIFTIPIALAIIWIGYLIIIMYFPLFKKIGDKISKNKVASLVTISIIIYSIIMAVVYILFIKN